jgi:putative transferase (TIGR04331 family)
MAMRVTAAADLVPLATTALEEFWPSRDGRQLVLLGPWCDVDGRRAPGSPVVPDPWPTQERLAEAVAETKAATDVLCGALASALGPIHGVSASARYWRLLLVPWLSRYVSVLADRAAVLEAARKTYGGLETILMDDDCFTTPRDTMDFSLLATDDPYNLQIFSFILRRAGAELPSQPFSWSRGASHGSGPSTTARLLHQLSFRADVIMRATYMPLAYEAAAGVRTAGRVWADHQNVSPRGSEALDAPLRARIGELLSTIEGGDLVRLAAAGAARDLPMCFVEDFAAWRECGSKTFGRAPKVVFTSNAWYWDEAFKHWAAQAAEDGALLAGHAHGGNYGSMLLLPDEDHEVEITDFYGSWGWTRPGDASVVPMPATKLMGRRTLGADERKQGLLFVISTSWRYLLQFPDTPQLFARYLEDQALFIRSLPPELLDDVLLRAKVDLGWHLTEKLFAAAGRPLRVDLSDSFQDSLRRCRLYVCDHLATTFIEALAQDKPTVLFWDPSNVALRPDAEPYYAELHSAGILHHDPQSAAEHVAAVYGGVEEWWARSDVQAARTRFCDRFGLTASKPLGVWLKTFERLAHQGRPRDGRGRGIDA